MNYEQFVFWLKGFVASKDHLTYEQYTMLLETLDTVRQYNQVSLPYIATGTYTHLRNDEGIPGVVTCNDGAGAHG